MPKKKSDIRDPTELEILERNRKKYNRLVNRYSKEIKKQQKAVEEYKALLRDTEKQIEKELGDRANN